MMQPCLLCLHAISLVPHRDQEEHEAVERERHQRDDATLFDRAAWHLFGCAPLPVQAGTCCKHFAAYDIEGFLGGPKESSRQSFNAELTSRDMWETYMPAFKVRNPSRWPLQPHPRCNWKRAYYKRTL